jgi:transposase
MIAALDIWRSAMPLVDQCGADALIRAAQRRPAAARLVGQSCLRPALACSLGNGRKVVSGGFTLGRRHGRHRLAIAVRMPGDLQGEPVRAVAHFGRYELCPVVGDVEENALHRVSITAVNDRAAPHSLYPT